MSDLRRVMNIIVPFWDAQVESVVAMWEWWLRQWRA